MLRIQICIPFLSNLRLVRSSLVIDQFSRDTRYQKDVMSQPRPGCRFSSAPLMTWYRHWDAVGLIGSMVSP